MRCGTFLIALLALTSHQALAQSVNYTFEYNGTMQTVHRSMSGEVVVSKETAAMTSQRRPKKKLAIIPIEIVGLAPPPVTKLDLTNFCTGTIGPYVNICTFSEVDLDMVVTDPVKIAPSGRLPVNSTFMSYGSNQCNLTNLVAWGLAAERRAPLAAQGASFLYFIVPPSANCDWETLATFDCVSNGDRCYGWVSGRSAYKIDAYARAFGRNFGFGDGVDLTYQYGDSGCAMGQCPITDRTCGPRCYNAVYSNRAGWVKPQAIVSRQTLIAGTWNTYMIAGFMSTSMNHLQLMWNETHKVYISMRTPLSQDVFMGVDNYYKLQVHAYDVTKPYPQSIRLGTVSVGQVWTPPLDTWVSLRIRYDNMYDALGTAKISMCIPYAHRELVFNDSLDDDCDTFVDLADVQDLCPAHYKNAVP